MKNSFKNRLIALGLSYQREIGIIILINIILIGASIGVYFINNDVMPCIFGGILLVIVNYVYFSRYGNMEKAREKERVEELISLLSYFEIFISNGNNVYNSFKMLLPYCSSFMDDAINTLLNQIDDDKSVGPFINFALKFNNRIVESLLLSIYQMVDNGEVGEQFREFDIQFSSINREHKDALIEETRHSLDSMNSWPLFAAAGITVMIAISVVGMIGDYINVI